MSLLSSVLSGVVAQAKSTCSLSSLLAREDKKGPTDSAQIIQLVRPRHKR